MPAEPSGAGEAHNGLSRRRDVRLFVAGATLGLVVIAMATGYWVVNAIFDREEAAVEQERLARLAARAQMRRDALVPKKGSTLHQVAAVRIGMTADEVKQTLQHPYALGYDLFPYGMRSPDHYWVVNDIPVKDKGYIQAVFIDQVLVGFGCVEPEDSRLCKTCLDQMLAGTRDWKEGLPCMIEDICPVCGGGEPVPLGSVLSGKQSI